MTARWTYERTADDQFQLGLDLREGGSGGDGAASAEAAAMLGALRRFEGAADEGAADAALGRVGSWRGEYHLPHGTRFQVAAVAASGPILTLVCKSTRDGYDESSVRGFVDMVNGGAPRGPAPADVPEPAAARTRSGIEAMAEYMVRGFHDWTFGENACLRGRYVLEPGFRRMIGAGERVISVHYAHLRDDWEDDFRRALDAWAELGFEFRAIGDRETAEIVVDDEKAGANATRRFRFTGRKSADLWVMETQGREINISKEWPEQGLLGAMLHELGHVLGLGHPGPYDGARPDAPMFPEDHSRHTVMSYFGPPAERLGDADRLAIEMLYGAAPAPAPRAPASRFVSADVGGGRFGFAAEPFPHYGLSRSAGSLERARELGVLALYEARPGKGGVLWLIADPPAVRAVEIAGTEVPVRYVTGTGGAVLYRANHVRWPSRAERARGIDVRIIRGG